MAMGREVRIAVGMTRTFRLEMDDGPSRFEELDEEDLTGTPTVVIGEYDSAGTLTASAIATLGTPTVDANDILVEVTGVAPGETYLYAGCDTDGGHHPGGRTRLVVE